VSHSVERRLDGRIEPRRHLAEHAARIPSNTARTGPARSPIAKIDGDRRSDAGTGEVVTFAWLGRPTRFEKPVTTSEVAEMTKPLKGVERRLAAALARD